MRTIADAYDAAIGRYPGLRDRVATLDTPYVVDLDGPTIYLSGTLTPTQWGAALMRALADLGETRTQRCAVLAFPEPHPSTRTRSAHGMN